MAHEPRRAWLFPFPKPPRSVCTAIGDPAAGPLGGSSAGKRAPVRTGHQAPGPAAPLDPLSGLPASFFHSFLCWWRNCPLPRSPGPLRPQPSPPRPPSLDSSGPLGCACTLPAVSHAASMPLLCRCKRCRRDVRCAGRTPRPPIMQSRLLVSPPPSPPRRATQTSDRASLRRCRSAVSSWPSACSAWQPAPLRAPALLVSLVFLGPHIPHALGSQGRCCPPCRLPCRIFGHRPPCWPHTPHLITPLSPHPHYCRLL